MEFWEMAYESKKKV